MKKLIFLSIAAVLAAGLAGCGDNKTKKKLIGSQMITSSNAGTGNLATKDGLSSAVMLGANVGAMACGKSTFANKAIEKAVSRTAGPTDLSGPDAEGYYSIPSYGFSNTTVKIRFQDASGTALTLGPTMASLAKFRIKITTIYSFGTFLGNFLITPDLTSSGQETMDSGTIETADPVGGTFKATITNMVVERTTINSTPIGIPISGSMSIEGSAGGFTYSGTNTYTHPDAATYACDGPINVSGAKVADVHLTFNKTFGNYTGYWIDAATGEQHTIQ